PAMRAKRSQEYAAGGRPRYGAHWSDRLLREKAVQNVEARFAALSEGSRTLARTSGAERADRLRRMLAAVLTHRKRFYDAAYTELKACDLDVAAQLVMLKSEVDHAARRVARWMKPRRVRNSAATLGKR